MTQPDKTVWHPSNNEQYMVHDFISHVEEKYRIKLKDYSDLHRWSVDKTSDFWVTFSEFSGMGLNGDIESVHQKSEHMIDSKWFTDSELNYAKALLSNRNEGSAIIYRDEKGRRIELSYSQLSSQVGSFIHTLDELGVQKGDVIAAVMTNGPETVIAMLACSAIGAVWTSCSPDFGVDAILDRFGQVSPKILITIDEYQYANKKHCMKEKMEAICEKLHSVEKVFQVNYGDSNKETTIVKNAEIFDQHLHKKIEPRYTPLPFDHPLFIMYSSGTTGKPKCIVHSAGGTLIQLMKEHQLHINIKPNDKVFFFTTCGWMMWNWLVTSMASKATIILYEGSPFHPQKDHLWKIADEEKITHFGISPRYISSLSSEKMSPIDQYELKHLKTVLSTGAPLLNEHFRFIHSSIKSDVQISSISGGTDIISCFALSTPMLPVIRGEIQSIGLGMDVRIFSHDGTESAKGEKGELVCCKAFPSMPLYFFNDSNKEKYKDAYFNKFPGVWAHGDYACRTKEDGLVIFGRSDATLNSGGVRIGTAEIYRQVEKIDEILEAVVVEIKLKNESDMVLFVVLKEGFRLDQKLIDHIKIGLKKNASPRHVPTEIISVNDIPRTISGKIAELTVKAAVEGTEIKNREALANPESVDLFVNIFDHEDGD
ncbi:acetoacetate--CoA ligase [Gammaproteobacteria bacterium]|nr:acetoacetate--CoA ligase [Gammaproteobacteria bacterium]